MGGVASLEDVARRLGRPLTTDELMLAETLVGDAENMIRVRLPGQVLDEDTADLSLVKQIVGAAVARVLRNPDGYRSETAGGVSYTIDTRAAAGFLTILTEEWSMLGLAPPTAAGKAFSFAPVLGTPTATGLVKDPWSTWC